VPGTKPWRGADVVPNPGAGLRSMLGDDADPQRVKMMQRGGPWIAWGLRWA